MQSQALPIDWVFQHPRSQAVKRLAEWRRNRAARRLDRRQAPHKMLPNLVQKIDQLTQRQQSRMTMTLTTRSARDRSSGNATIAMFW